MVLPATALLKMAGCRVSALASRGTRTDCNLTVQYLAWTVQIAVFVSTSSTLQLDRRSPLVCMLVEVGCRLDSGQSQQMVTNCLAVATCLPFSGRQLASIPEARPVGWPAVRHSHQMQPQPVRTWPSSTSKAASGNHGTDGIWHCID